MAHGQQAVSCDPMYCVYACTFESTRVLDGRHIMLLILTGLAVLIFKDAKLETGGSSMGTQNSLIAECGAVKHWRSREDQSQILPSE